LLLAAFEDGNPVLYLEHKLLYRSAKGRVPEGHYTLPLGEARVVRDGSDATVVSYSVGVHWALQAAEALAAEGRQIEVIDLRSLMPWDSERVLESVRKTGRCLVLHEAPLGGGVRRRGRGHRRRAGIRLARRARDPAGRAGHAGAVRQGARGGVLAEGPLAARAAGAAALLMRRVLRVVLKLVVALVVVVAAATAFLGYRLRASLPAIDGQRQLFGLQAALKVERDALGVPTLTGASRLDLARGLGFLHAQDRYFQMDLLRRRAAGELSELFGPAALPADRPARQHRLRARAQRVLAAASTEERSMLEVYAAGANAGLQALGAPPFEYLALGETPRAWRPEDSVLVVYAMFLDLNDENGDREAMLGTLHDTLPEPLFAFLAPEGTEWDAPDVGGLAPAVPPPGPHVIDLRTLSKAAANVAAPERRSALETEIAEDRSAATTGRSTAPTRRTAARCSRTTCTSG
jgi:hypothetical protein